MSSPSLSVAIGSINPVKIAAVSQAFTAVWPDQTFSFKGTSVPSGVSAQPMSDLESLKGAVNRARRARTQLKADYGVGLEGGVQAIGSHWFDCGWIVVINRQNIQGLGSTARIITPPKMVARLRRGQELGEVVDYFFKTKNAKQGDGHFGLMTNGRLTRTQGYRDGVIMALSRFLHPELF